MNEYRNRVEIKKKKKKLVQYFRFYIEKESFLSKYHIIRVDWKSLRTFS